MFPPSLRAVKGQRSALAELVAGLDPEAVPLCDAPAMWEQFAAMERLAGSAKTLLARRVDASREAKRQGYRSTSDMLAAKEGTSVAAARRELETSERVAELPGTSAALGRGDLSGPQAEAIAGAAAANPEAETRLLDKAGRSSLGELREDCGRAKAAADPDPDATHRRLHAERCLRRTTGANGAWELYARGTPDAGAKVNAALDPIIDQIFRAAYAEGRRESRDAYAFDALVELARRARTGITNPSPEPSIEADANDGTADRAEDDTETAPVAPTPAKAPNPTHLALLRLDLEALVRGAVEGGELCEITGIGPVPVSVARKLLGDSVLKLVITKGVDVANVTHLGRGPTVAQRIALLWSSPHCIVEGCHRRRVEIDHREPWAETRHTVLDELEPCCDHHHDKKTYEGWELVVGTGRRPMVPPDDPRHPKRAAGQARAGPGGGATSDEPGTLFYGAAP